MKLTVIDTGYFKLDGGAMFGVVPKTMWGKIHPPDEKNLCTWAMRCLLAETGNRKILVDTGLGDKQDAKFRSHFEPHGDDSLIASLAKAGHRPEDITDVFLTHLHFDHCGGALRYGANGKIEPVFPNATYWTNQAHYDWAFTPNAREAASFLKENFVPLREEGILKFIDPAADGEEWLPGIRPRFMYGHTEAMMLPEFKVGDKTILYCADLIASEFHLGLPWVMAYDVRPLQTLKEKEPILNRAAEEGMIFFYEHAPKNECSLIGRNEHGKIVALKSGKLEEMMG